MLELYVEQIDVIQWQASYFLAKGSHNFSQHFLISQCRTHLTHHFRNIAQRKCGDISNRHRKWKLTNLAAPLSTPYYTHSTYLRSNNM